MPPLEDGTVPTVENCPHQVPKKAPPPSLSDRRKRSVADFAWPLSRLERLGLRLWFWGFWVRFRVAMVPIGLQLPQQPSSLCPHRSLRGPNQSTNPPSLSTLPRKSVGGSGGRGGRGVRGSEGRRGRGGRGGRGGGSAGSGAGLMPLGVSGVWDSELPPFIFSSRPLPASNLPVSATYDQP